MSEEYKQLINKSAWHAEDGYDEGERVRLSRACEFIQTHAPHATCDDRQCAVLDIGCGVGPLREWLGSDRFNITGMEISPEAAAEARNRYDACLVADIETAWPVEAETFDAVHAGAKHTHDRGGYRAWRGQMLANGDRVDNVKAVILELGLFDNRCNTVLTPGCRGRNRSISQQVRYQWGSSPSHGRGKCPPYIAADLQQVVSLAVLVETPQCPGIRFLLP